MIQSLSLFCFFFRMKILCSQNFFVKIEISFSHILFISEVMYYHVLIFLLPISFLSLAEVWNPRVDWIHHKFEKNNTTCSFLPRCNQIVFPVHCFYELGEGNWQCSFNLSSTNGWFTVSSYNVSCSNRNNCTLHADVHEVISANWLLGAAIGFVATLLFLSMRAPAPKPLLDMELQRTLGKKLWLPKVKEWKKEKKLFTTLDASSDMEEVRAALDASELLQNMWMKSVEKKSGDKEETYEAWLKQKAKQKRIRNNAEDALIKKLIKLCGSPKEKIQEINDDDVDSISRRIQ